MAGLVASFGSGAMTNSIPEFEEANCVLITGSNTSEAHPMIGTGSARQVGGVLRGKTHRIVDLSNELRRDARFVFSLQRLGDNDDTER